MNKKTKSNKEAKQLLRAVKPLSDEEVKNVNGGMKVAVEEESSWFQTIVDFFFKVNR